MRKQYQLITREYCKGCCTLHECSNIRVSIQEYISPCPCSDCIVKVMCDKICSKFTSWGIKVKSLKEVYEKREAMREYNENSM